MLLKILTIISLFNMQNHVPDYVLKFHKVYSEKEELKYIETYKNNSNINIKAYVISLQMKQAKYKIFPLSKLGIFKKEKQKLNQLIKEHPKNIHLRYVRLVIQEQTPKFLGYNEFIEEDKHFLKNMLKVADSTDYLDTYILKNTSL